MVLWRNKPCTLGVEALFAAQITFHLPAINKHYVGAQLMMICTDWPASLWWQKILCCMMTSSSGNIFRATGPLCGEFTGHRNKRSWRHCNGQMGARPSVNNMLTSLWIVLYGLYYVTQISCYNNDTNTVRGSSEVGTPWFHLYGRVLRPTLIMSNVSKPISNFRGIPTTFWLVN